jgi:hypothetical protein
VVGAKPPSSRTVMSNDGSTNAATGSTRVAIEFLTLWLEPGEQGARRQTADHIARVLYEEGEDPVSVIAGQLNLGMLLVLRLAKERGATEADMFQKAADILRDLSRRLPE